MKVKFAVGTIIIRFKLLNCLMRIIFVIRQTKMDRKRKFGNGNKDDYRKLPKSPSDDDVSNSD